MYVIKTFAMELNLQEIERLSRLRENENLRFRSYLKSKHAPKIDRMVHELYAFYSKEIDCIRCGNCCTKLRPVMKELDIDVLTKVLNLSRENFRKKYIMIDNEGDMLFKHLPCKFLEDKKCSIYESRPHDCQSYPHLHKNEFTNRLYGVLENYAICPIVYNVIEDLKRWLGFR
jgi:Fe-S-cluster containining protein